MKKTLLLSLLFSLTAPASAGFFKCQSADGRIQYSDTPCAQSTVYNRDAAAATPAPAAEPPLPQEKTLPDVPALSVDTSSKQTAEDCRKQGLVYQATSQTCRQP